MYFQYPLEALARRRARGDQLAFAREAHRILDDTDEVMFEPIARGLAIFAAHEEALEAPRRILRDAYGDLVDVRRPRVRYIPGEPGQQPIMHVRIAARSQHAFALCAELRLRGARVLEECSRGREFVVRAEAPMEALLGLPACIDEITGGLAAHSIRLIRYDPLDAR